MERQRTLTIGKGDWGNVVLDLLISLILSIPTTEVIRDKTDNQVTTVVTAIKKWYIKSL